MFTGFSQIVTAVVGAGILALPSALAALGWVAGILLLGALFFFIPGGAQDPTTTRPPPPPPTVIFAIITYYTTILLIDCYEYKGVRHKTYYAAVCHLLPGTPWPILMQVLQQANLVLTGALLFMNALCACHHMSITYGPLCQSPFMTSSPMSVPLHYLLPSFQHSPWVCHYSCHSTTKDCKHACPA